MNEVKNLLDTQSALCIPHPALGKYPKVYRLIIHNNFSLMKLYYYAGIFAASVAALCSCGSAITLDSYVAEESGLNIQKITDESKGAVLAGTTTQRPVTFVRSSVAGCKKLGLYWSTHKCLSLSPDGNNIAYLTRSNKQDNVMIHRATAAGTSTQRTFRDVRDFSYGPDENIYFSDYVGNYKWQIHAVSAKAGSVMRQLTSNNNDYNPVLAKDGHSLYFTRMDNNGPAIWCLDTEDGTLTSCSKGYDACPIGDGSEEFLCVRNSDEGVSQIWLVNYITGSETLVLADKERGFSNPAISPDGRWIVVQGSSRSAAGKVKNLDLFAVKIDGTQFIQLTYHPAHDCNPLWSADGKSIFFISSRSSKDHSFNVWKMRFNL